MFMQKTLTLFIKCYTIYSKGYSIFPKDMASFMQVFQSMHKSMFMNCLRRTAMKRYRIMKIKEIIQSQIIETQEELANALRKEGIVVTQATVSRDIKDLMLLKIPYGDGHYRYALPSEKPNVMSKSHTAILFQEAVIKIDSAMNMVVLHTLPGSASSVAFAIDHSRTDEVIGTLAGDDTVLLILKTPDDVPAMIKKIQGLLKN